LRDAGDIPHLAALLAPRRLVVAGAVTGAGRALGAVGSGRQFVFTRRGYSLLEASTDLIISSSSDAGEIATCLK
jgi:hypothetical protein